MLNKKINRLLLPFPFATGNSSLLHSLPLRSTLHTRYHHTSSQITIPPSSSGIHPEPLGIQGPHPSMPNLSIHLASHVCLAPTDSLPTHLPPPHTPHMPSPRSPIRKPFSHTLPVPLHYPNPARPSGSNWSLPPLRRLLLKPR